MRRLRALALFTLGYWAIATLSPAVAAVPAFMAFLAAGLVLGRGAGSVPARSEARQRRRGIAV